MRPLRQRVATSAWELDREQPLWAALSDPTRLDMRCDRRCILGFIAGSYTQGLRYLGLADGHDAEERAFTTRDTREWHLLNQYWREEISTRVAA